MHIDVYSYMFLGLAALIPHSRGVRIIIAASGTVVCIYTTDEMSSPASSQDKSTLK